MSCVSCSKPKTGSLVLRSKGLRCLCITGGAAPGVENKALSAPTPTHVLVATPGRLLDLVASRKVSKTANLNLLVDLCRDKTLVLASCCMFFFAKKNVFRGVVCLRLFFDKFRVLRLILCVFHSHRWISSAWCSWLSTKLTKSAHSASQIN